MYVDLNNFPFLLLFSNSVVCSSFFFIWLLFIYVAKFATVVTPHFTFAAILAASSALGDSAPSSPPTLAKRHLL